VVGNQGRGSIRNYERWDKKSIYYWP
jgi:hypothetical protein